MVSVPCIVDNSNGFFLFILSLCRLVVFREHILVFFRKFWIISVRFETVLFVSVVFKKVRNTETNRKNFFFSFTKQTETNVKQILFRFVSVRTKIYFCLLRGHPSVTPLQGTVIVRDVYLRLQACCVYKNIRILDVIILVRYLAYVPCFHTTTVLLKIYSSVRWIKYK
jgi:hypothetical protein